jgi:hypothetical protein
MRNHEFLGALSIWMALAACGGSSSPPSNGFPQPARTVAVNFTGDDTANKVYTAGNLQWKGSMIYDPNTRKITKDGTWGGPWAPLYDDGPWTAGGHEPIGSVAGDNKWGITAFATPPATGSDTYEYGVIDSSAPYNGAWLWVGPNGKASVAASATAPVNSAGLSLANFGTTDMQLTIDTSKLIAGTWPPSKITVKSSAWAGVEVQLINPVGTVYTFNLSQAIGAGKLLPHTGLPNSGSKPVFSFWFTGTEYRNASMAATGGVGAATKVAGASAYTPATISIDSANNTYITIP